jgi:hypothetical protein
VRSFFIWVFLLSTCPIPWPRASHEHRDRNAQIFDCIAAFRDVPSTKRLTHSTFGAAKGRII